MRWKGLPQCKHDCVLATSGLSLERSLPREFKAKHPSSQGNIRKLLHRRDNLPE